MDSKQTGSQPAEAANSTTQGRMTGRLVWAIISTIMEETGLVLIVTMGLPKLGINLPVWVLPPLMLAWLTYTVTMYRKGTRALQRKPVVGLPDMVGARGKVVRTLAPEGAIRIGGELWTAQSSGGEVAPGQEVVVVSQNRLRLVVSRTGHARTGGRKPPDVPER